MKENKAKVIWFTGLSGSGKSTISEAILGKFENINQKAIILDGDKLRNGINKDLGFSIEDRVENIRRVAEIAKLFLSVGIVPICAFISPTEKIRELAKNIIGEANFIEIYVSTPFEICEERDVKGLYKKARLGQIEDFTGISSPYEKPKNAKFMIDTSNQTIEESVNICFERVLSYILIEKMK